jgi:glycosyltransferase involved in cell wall biosynthesis
MIKVSIILCTYNRCQLLVPALESAAALQASESIDYEIVVVDNNSNDQTRAVIEEFCRRYPERFRYLFEPRQGKSYAMNSAIQATRGDILAFMDDDATVEPAWLENLVSPLQNPEYAGVGGKIIAEWTCPRPDWLPQTGQYALAPLVSFDRGPDPKQLKEAPFGANMAFRRVMFERYGGFRVDLGPRGQRFIPNDDSEFALRLLAAGEQLFYEPGAIVHHPVTADRLQKDYFLRWWREKGRSDIRAATPPLSAVASMGNILRRLPNWAIWTLKWLFTWEPRLRFQNKMIVWTKLGEMAEVISPESKRQTGSAGTQLQKTSAGSWSST